MKLNTIGLIFGFAFGALLTGANLHEYDTIHAMLRLDEFDVYFLMASAIATSAPLLWLLEKRGIVTPFGGPLSLSRSKPERKHVVGGALFGLGWAIAGTCPAPALIMTTSGAMLGVVAIAGIFLGLHLRERQTMRQLQVTAGVGTIDVGSGDGEHRDLPTATR